MDTNMADFGFIGPSYNAPSIYVDAQECINFFPEIDPLKQPGSRGVVALYPTPGISIQATLQTASPVRGMRTVSGGAQLVVVCGQYVYSLNATLTPVIIGQLITNTGNVLPMPETLYSLMLVKSYSGLQDYKTTRLTKPVWVTNPVPRVPDTWKISITL